MISQYLANFLMFPGVIFHQVVRLWLCQLLRVAVYDACFIRFDKQSGYVHHERPAEASQSVILTIGPLIAGSIIGALIALPSVVPDLEFGVGTPLDFFMLWLGVSIATKGFPTKEEVRALAALAKSPELSAGWKAVAYPSIAVIYLGVFGRFASLDVLYGTGVTLIMPFLLVSMGR